MQQKLETFSLMKKDLEKKDQRIKELVLEHEKLSQKTQTNEEFIAQLQSRLEEAQEKSGNITGKFESELTIIKSIVSDQTNEIENLKDNESKLKNKLYEAEQIEDRLLTEMQQVKDKNLKLESELESKETELIELKKKIKILRRDSQKA